jgi:hypothetical protein
MLLCFMEPWNALMRLQIIAQLSKACTGFQVMLAQQRSITQLIEVVNQHHQQAQALLTVINHKQSVDAQAEPEDAVTIW